MVAAALTPRIRLLAMCDGVRESKAEPGVYHLRGVRQAMKVNRLPFAPLELWLFLLLSTPRPGEYPGYILVMSDTTDRAVFHAKLEPRPTFASNDNLYAGRTRIRCSFPGPGPYTVQLWFFQEHGNDVLKGEIPFAIMREEG
jgi:hypothetical protein